MKNLTLKDNSLYSCEDESTIEKIKIKIDASESEAVITKMTKENFSKCNFDNQEYFDRIPTQIGYTDNNEVEILTREKTLDEYIIEQGQQILELQEAFAQVIGG